MLNDVFIESLVPSLWSSDIYLFVFKDPVFYIHFPKIQYRRSDYLSIAASAIMASESNSLSRKSNADQVGKKRKRTRISPHSPKIDEPLHRLLTGQDDDTYGEAPGLSLNNPRIEPVEDHGKFRDSSGQEDTPITQASASLPKAHANRLFVTVLLENANLETVKQDSRKGGVMLLNCDDHAHLLKKTGREANEARPDIVHQCLLMLLDSPLNKAGRLKVYIRTANNVLIDVDPQTRIPRTIKRFSGLMSELLEKFKVRGTVGFSPLLKVIKNPVTSYLPVGAHKIVCTYNTENVVDIQEHARRIARHALPQSSEKTLPTDEDIADRGQDVHVVYVVGAMAHGKVIEEWADDYICISEYPLSGATVCSKITNAYESLLGIL